MEAWREGLERLREMEDEVGNVMRDREILCVCVFTLAFFVPSFAHVVFVCMCVEYIIE